MATDEEIQLENELNVNNVTKYQTAADIANRALSKVIEACSDNAKIVEICQLGDKFIQEQCLNVYNKGKVAKGIAFPTSISINGALCHLSPLMSDPEAEWTLKAGEFARIELGVHVDGYIAQVAHTILVGASKDAPITGKQADVMQAAYLASEAAIRLIKPGKTNFDVTEAVQKIAKEFDCIPVEGMLTHQIQRNVLDGPKHIIFNPNDNQKKDTETQTFEEGEVYSVDILISTGEGKPKVMDTRTTIYKKNADSVYNLKMKTSRAVLSEITKASGQMAFTLRSLEDEKKGRLGILECANHGLVSPYAVLYESKEAHVAHFMFTVLLMPSGPLKITSFPWNQDLVKSDKEIKDEEIKELLKQSVRPKNKKKKKATAEASA